MVGNYWKRNHKTRRHPGIPILKGRDIRDPLDSADHFCFISR